jgi:hypothetical protein
MHAAVVQLGRVGQVGVDRRPDGRRAVWEPQELDLPRAQLARQRRRQPRALRRLAAPVHALEQDERAALRRRHGHLKKIENEVFFRREMFARCAVLYCTVIYIPLPSVPL